jgi:hypothetical protein
MKEDDEGGGRRFVYLSNQSIIIFRRKKKMFQPRYLERITEMVKRIKRRLSLYISKKYMEWPEEGHKDR